MEQYIVFVNNSQNLALNISKIERIIAFQQPKKIPESSDYLLGVIQHNGQILPIVDLTMRLYEHYAPEVDDKKIIVVKWKNRLIGFVVEEIVSIESFHSEQYEEMLQQNQISKEYIHGFILMEEDIIIVLDTDRIFDFEQAKEIKDGIEQAEDIEDGFEYEA